MGTIGVCSSPAISRNSWPLQSNDNCHRRLLLLLTSGERNIIMFVTGPPVYPYGGLNSQSLCLVDLLEMLYTYYTVSSLSVLMYVYIIWPEGYSVIIFFRFVSHKAFF